MLKRIAETIPGPTATQINWKYSRDEVVEGVEHFFSAVKEREKREQEFLESLWDTVKLFAAIAGGALETPILVGVAGAFAPFAAIGMGYMEAGEEIKRKNAPMALTHGVVLGVMAETPDNVRDYFWQHHPTPNVVFPAGAQIAQYYWNGGLVLGYGHGRDVFARKLAPVFWADVKRQLTTTFGDPQKENWRRNEWINFYTTVATAFYRLHIRE
jgi:hypothetical protein